MGSCAAQEEDGGELWVYRRRKQQQQQQNPNCVAVDSNEEAIKKIKPSGDTLVLLRCVSHLFIYLFIYYLFI